VALGCLPEHHDRLLLDLFAPIVRQITGDSQLDSFFFVRYADPEWQLRFRVLGRPEWIETHVRPRVDAAIVPFVNEGAVNRVEFGTYAREWDRYGGPEGMRLAERVFLHDSIACLAILEAERAGRSTLSRREYSLAFTERLLDLFGFDAALRLAFYREGQAWAFRDGVFRDEDKPRLEGRYRDARVSLRSRFFEAGGGSLEAAFGEGDTLGIATTALQSMRPAVEDVVSGHRAGTIRQNLVYLAWSYAHLHCNRLGIDVVPEAILRYLMFRLYEDETASGPSS
jgi:thiopeptide-type bacteriocin biosynthesis protein